MILKNSIRLFLFALSINFFLTQTSNAAFNNDLNISTENQKTEKPVEIIGNIVTLRELKVDYFRKYYEMFSPTVRAAIEYSRESTIIEIYLNLFKRIQQHESNQTFQYIIFDNADEKLIGLIEIREKTHATYGQFACWINENYWGGGRFQEAANLISKAYLH